MAEPMPPVPNVVSVLVRGTITGEIWENVYHYQYSGSAPTQAACQGLAGSLHANWVSQMAQLCPAQVSLSEVLVTDMASVNGAQGANAVVVPGTRTGGMLPANAACLVSYPLSLRYRGGKPRTYLLVGTDTDLQDPMNFNTAFTNLVLTMHTNFLNSALGTGTGGTTFNQVVALRRHGRYLLNNGPPHYVLQTPIVLPILPASSIVHQQIASQKGRIGRRSK
jgi:hypothetical protein